MTQEEALRILKTGANVFVTGEPGAGKTYVINEYVRYLREHAIDVAVTASTGIAATHIGGMTIHAWSGVGVRDHLSPYDLEAISSRERVVKRINASRVLIIDEVSMLDGNTLAMVEEICRTIRRKREPFGGLQVVLVGDFFQLPPIGTQGRASQFAFESMVWDDLGLIVCYLSEQHRQDDATLLDVLGAFRRGEIDQLHMDILMACSDTTFPEHIEPTRLFTHNADVDRINSERLAKLPGPSRVFSMERHGSKQLVESLTKSCLSPENLELRVGAMVMCTKNNFEAGYANGTLGTVVNFDSDTGYPVIETLGGATITVSPAEWRIEEDRKILAEVRQIPLRLAWAITVHKSQGMSLDAAEIDLSAAFEYGQGYVALSRVRSLRGLLLHGCNDRALQVHPHVVLYDVELRKQSAAAAAAFSELPKEDIEPMHEAFIRACGGSLLAKAPESAPFKKEKSSTREKTRELILRGKSIREIAEERNLKEATIIDHLESLVADGRLTADSCRHLATALAGNVRRDVRSAFEACGDSALKPVYDYLGRQYSYDTLRLARFLYQRELL